MATLSHSLCRDIPPWLLIGSGIIKLCVRDGDNVDKEKD